MPRIGIWNTAWLGDAVLTLPLLEHVKRNFSYINVDYYVRQGLGSLFTCVPYIDNVYEFNKKTGGILACRRYGREIAERKYSIWISAHSSLRSLAIAHMTKAQVLIGYDSGRISRLVYTHTVDRGFSELEEIERVLKLAVPLGFELDLKNRQTNWPRLTVCPQAKAKADQIWLGLNPERPVLGIHPGSAWPTKRWPAEYAAEVALLAAEHNVQIMLFAAPHELEGVNEVRKSMRGYSGFTDLAGKLSLPELAACLGRLDCYLGNDAGPTHLAWVQGTPTVAIFGPTVREFGFAPRGEKSAVVEISLPCRPCGLHGHKSCPKKHHACMRNIKPLIVWKEIAEKIELGSK